MDDYVKYQPEVKEGVMDGALEIKTILMTDFDPVIRWTRDLGDKVVDVPENAEAALKANRIEADRRDSSSTMSKIN